ncbi:YjbF family lipoprotein [Puniceibacterium sediminis]|nr:YjbF family lipoprotein [Puniceibacterium sediminis]
MRKISLALCVAMTLASCGSDPNIQQVGMVRNALRGLFSPPPKVNLRQTLTPEVLENFNQPLLLVDLPDRGLQAGALLVQQNGLRQIWQTQDGVTLTLESGILTETRGLGGDLMTTDLGRIGAAIRGEINTSARIHRYLNGEDHLEAKAFVCTYAIRPNVPVSTLAGNFNTLRVTEDCVGPEITFQNRYWLDGRGLMRKTRQWVGPNVGYADTELVKE